MRMRTANSERRITGDDDDGLGPLEKQYAVSWTVDLLCLDEHRRGPLVGITRSRVIGVALMTSPETCSFSETYSL